MGTEINTEGISTRDGRSQEYRKGSVKCMEIHSHLAQSFSSSSWHSRFNCPLLGRVIPLHNGSPIRDDERTKLGPG